MAIKCITGILVPETGYARNGKARINLTDGSIVDDTRVDFAEVAMFGGEQLFSAKPCVHIALREIVFHDSDSYNAIEFPQHDRRISIDLDDNFLEGFSILEVSWRTSVDALSTHVKEISVMVIGET